MIKITQNIEVSTQSAVGKNKKVTPSILTSQSINPSGLFVSCSVELSSSPSVKKKSLLNL